jgi:hypothetical protein
MFETAGRTQTTERVDRCGKLSWPITIKIEIGKLNEGQIDDATANQEDSTIPSAGVLGGFAA